ncbi:retrovirus-related pol polyprotein from transposon TNT 1-94 [Tanacetum coccineum]|uniref:Retrovirus-related pol polyprotein from transposon TNT 1-94 n=1 Tax=Tanacetum coccineum TaxID=301880 RepID=A0ABQ5EVB6_9ASTR
MGPAVNSPSAGCKWRTPGYYNNILPRTISYGKYALSPLCLHAENNIINVSHRTLSRPQAAPTPIRYTQTRRPIWRLTLMRAPNRHFSLSSKCVDTSYLGNIGIALLELPRARSQDFHKIANGGPSTFAISGGAGYYEFMGLNRDHVGIPAMPELHNNMELLRERTMTLLTALYSQYGHSYSSSNPFASNLISSSRGQEGRTSLTGMILQDFKGRKGKLMRKPEVSGRILTTRKLSTCTTAKASGTNFVNTVSIPVSTASANEGLSLSDTTSSKEDDSEIPPLEDIHEDTTDGIFTHSSYDDEGAEADFTNLETVVNVSPIPTSRINPSHPSTLILGDPTSAVQTRSKVNKSSEAHAFVYVSQPPGFLDPKSPEKVYKVVKALYGLHQAPRAWYATLSTFLLKNGYRRGTIDKTLFLRKDKHDIILVQVYVDDIIFGSTKKSCQDKYVAEILKKFDFASVKTASTPIETQKPLVKDEEASDVDVHLYRSMIGSLIDYAGANLDRKSTTEGCQFLGRGLITWNAKADHCATSKQKADCCAASCCCKFYGFKIKLLDYGFNLHETQRSTLIMNCTFCFVKNPVYHSKTKHIAIRHHFIRDAYEKKLIQVLKIHTDDNVVDLLTKAFEDYMNESSVDDERGNEDEMTLPNVYDLCISLCQQKRLPRKSSSKKQRMHKESISKQGRKIAKGESSVQRDPMEFGYDNAEDNIDQMETDNAHKRADDQVEGTKEKNEGIGEIFESTKEQRPDTEEKVESTAGQIENVDFLSVNEIQQLRVDEEWQGKVQEEWSWQVIEAKDLAGEVQSKKERVLHLEERAKFLHDTIAVLRRKLSLLNKDQRP